MKFLVSFALLAASITPLASAWDHPLAARQAQQSLSSALSSHADLSTFNQLLNSYPDIISNVTTGGQNRVTILVPTNDAFTKYLQQSNVSDLAALPVDRLLNVFRYHTLEAGLTVQNFSAPRGITVPTKLRDALNNLRSPGAAIIDQFGADAQGQVLYVAPDAINPAKFRVRQTSDDDKTASLRAGLGQTATLTTIDGIWDGGFFQSIDAVLEVPTVCSTTIKKLSGSLSSLKDALDKTKLWKDLDAKPNITCLAPNTDAFREAGNPQNELGNEDLKNALLFHTLPQVSYSNFLTDGQEFISLSNNIVRVTVRDNEIWFNDAKVVSPNVLTNNGLIHVLDRVMSPNATGPASEPSSTAPSGLSGAASPTGGPGNAGNPVSGNMRSAAVIAFAACLLII
ncbi:Fasciclin-like arabinogalactan protein-like protein 6 [Colletotrichum chlorophyti]|uniref:Fasciclin-like arabinogalactan protein-like protein 6 n=1 Tax=Colletotrichum chlorophyti TaxID=708187 RepID=A0A1Q8RP41_9PEZI|nr:Fasciclin-like arabinogalactan protein-like protein 6 [Colletotrichum chlorophyti]